MAGSATRDAGREALFTSSRLMGYKGRLSGSVEPAKLALGNSMALAPHVLFGPVVDVVTQAVSAGLDAAPHAGNSSLAHSPPPDNLPARSLAHQGSGGQDTASGLVGDVRMLKAEVAGLQCVLAHLKGSEAISTLGTRARTTRRMRREGINQAGPRSKASKDHSPPAAGGEDGGALQHRVSIATASRTDNSEQGFDALTVEDPAAPAGVSWRRHTSIVPVGRGEAIILEAALDEALPEGAISGTYTAAARDFVALLAGKYSPAAPTVIRPARVLLGSRDIRHDVDLLDGVLKEAARQVAAGCAERGRLILKVGDRYREVFSSMGEMVAAVSAGNAWLTAALQKEREAAACTADELEAVKGQLREKQKAEELLQFQVVSASTELEHARWDAVQERAALTEQNQILVRRAEEAAAELEKARAEHAAVLHKATSALEAQAQLIDAHDARDDLASRVRFLEKRIVAMKLGASRVTPTDDIAIQTDPMDWYDDGLDADQEDSVYDMDQASPHTPGNAAGPATGKVAPVHVKRKRRGPRPLGGFEGMVQSERMGRIRGLHWTQVVIQQIYIDKIVQDATSDRDGSPRQKICEFVYAWHMQKFGLASLAESNLLDLVASVRHHATTINRVMWFAQFIGLYEVAHGVYDTTHHLSFYLFLLQQLAYPTSLSCLFPDQEDGGAARIAVAGLPEAAKNVFRYLNDLDMAPAFIEQHMDGMAEHEYGTYEPMHVGLDTLIRVFMSEYQARYDKATSHLTALFCAGDSDRDGLIGYDTLSLLLDIAMPEAQPRMKAAMYAEALRKLGPRQNSIPCALWLDVARSYGLDRWRVDPVVLAQQLPGLRPPSAGQLLAQGPGVLALLFGGNSTPTAGKGRTRPRSGSAEHRLSNSAAGMQSALHACLAAMQPSLPDLLQQAHTVLHENSPVLAQIRQQAWHLAHCLNDLPDAKQAPEVQRIITCTVSYRPPAQVAPAPPTWLAPTPVASPRTPLPPRPANAPPGRREASNTAMRAQPPQQPPDLTIPSPPGPADALQAWLALHALFITLAPVALPASRPGSRSGRGADSPAPPPPRVLASVSCPGSPRLAKVIQPAVWRSGRPAQRLSSSGGTPPGPAGVRLPDIAGGASAGHVGFDALGAEASLLGVTGSGAMASGRAATRASGAADAVPGLEFSGFPRIGAA